MVKHSAHVARTLDQPTVTGEDIHGWTVPEMIFLPIMHYMKSFSVYVE